MIVGPFLDWPHRVASGGIAELVVTVKSLLALPLRGSVRLPLRGPDFAESWITRLGRPLRLADRDFTAQGMG